MVEKGHTQSLSIEGAQKGKSTVSVFLSNSLDITGGEKLLFNQLGYVVLDRDSSKLFGRRAAFQFCGET